MKVYFYRDVPRPENNDYGRFEYRGLMPFSEETLGGVTQVFDPDQAELFYGGQFHDTRFNELIPERFEYLKGNESRHVFDLEGDANVPIPSWLRESTLICMNAMPEQRDWPRIYVRLGLSFLLARIARGENFIDNRITPERGFSFMGQLFPLRVRLLNICKKLKLEGCWGVNPFWGSQLPPDHPKVHQYVEAMQRCAFALCPHGNGPGMSTRFYEACYFGSIPILIGDNMLVGEPGISETLNEVIVRLPSTVSDDDISEMLTTCMAMPSGEILDRQQAARLYFDLFVRPQLESPTGEFLRWYLSGGSR